MSWAKESADAGVAGLSEWEVVRGVMQGEVDVDLPEVPETAFVKVEPGEDESWIEGLPDPQGRQAAHEPFLVVSAFYFIHVEEVEDILYKYTCIKWYACRRGQRQILKYMYCTLILGGRSG